MTGRVVSHAAVAGRAASARRHRDRSVRAAVLLLVPVVTLLVVGLGAILSSSSVVGLRESGDGLFYFKRQVIWAGVGVLAMAVAIRVPHDVYRRAALPVLILSMLSLLAVVVAGVERGGARRWLEVGPLTVQPSEFAKFAVVAFLAAVLARRKASLEQPVAFFVPMLVGLGSAGALILAQRDLGTTLIVAVAGIAVAAASAAPIRYVVATAAAGGLAGAAFAVAEPYRFARLQSFLDPQADVLGDGFQAMQSLVALGTGGWFGVGLGASRARWSFLPNAHTDFIFAIIGEELGFAGAMVVIALFVAFAIGGTTVALRAPDDFGRLLGIGIVAWLSVQALINVGGVVSVLPITGVPLPFVSTGGTALVVNLAAAGVLANIARAGASR